MVANNRGTLALKNKQNVLGSVGTVGTKMLNNSLILLLPTAGTFLTTLVVSNGVAALKGSEILVCGTHQMLIVLVKFFTYLCHLPNLMTIYDL